MIPKTPECKAAVEASKDIPGWLLGGEQTYLYNLGFHSSSNIVEIGTYMGKSAFLIAAGIRDSGRKNTLITIDIHKQKDTWNILLDDRLLSVTKMIRDHKLDKYIIHCIGWSHDVLKFLDFKRIGAVFIDGGHDFDSCKGDFLTIRERIYDNQKVRLIFHDEIATFPGVVNTIKLAEKDPCVTFVERIGSMYVCDCRKK